MRAQIIDECKMYFGDQIVKGSDGKMHFEYKELYSSWDLCGLESAKTWKAAPSPKKVDPKESQEKLEKGFTVTTGDGRIAVMDRAVLDHWMLEKNKLQSDIDSRLESLDYAIETLKHPQERWDQDTQCRYLKVFPKATGGFEGCMVCITSDNKCRTYFVPSVKALDKMRNGKSCQVF